MLAQDSIETLIQLVAKWELYNISSKRERRLHTEEINRTKYYHQKDLQLSKQIYLRSLYYDMREHEIQLDFDIINAYKANERDMYDQKNRQCQTMIVANSIMLSALISILIQSIIPIKTPEFAKIVFSLSGSISLSFLALSIIFYNKIIFICTKFMDDRGKYHASQWKSVKDRIIARESQIDKTESIIRSTDDDKEMMNKKFKENLNKDINDTLKKSQDRNVRDKEKFFLKKPNGIVHVEINGDSNGIEHFVVEDVENPNIPPLNRTESSLAAESKIFCTFEEYWKDKCRLYDMFGTLSFYAGTMMLLINLIIYNYEYFYYTYKNNNGAIISTVIISFSLLIAFLALVMIKVRIFIDE